MKMKNTLYKDVTKKMLRSASLIFIFTIGCAQDPAFVEKYGQDVQQVSTDNVDVDVNNGDDATANINSNPIIAGIPNTSGASSNSNSHNSSNPNNGENELPPNNNDDPPVPSEPSLEEQCSNGTAPLNECLPFYTFVTQNVTQSSKKKVDILWIVDNSGSMSEEQTFLANSFNYFINQLINLNISFQMAVTSTDICDDTMPPLLEDRSCPILSSGYHHRGRFVGEKGKQVLKNDTINLINLFTSYTALGTKGSGFEHGLKAAQLAIQKVLSGENDPLLRDDAFLSIIVISDEEDDGIGLAMQDAFTGRNFWEEGLTRFRFTDDDLINYLKNVKGAGKFSVSAIAATADANGKPCVSPHASTKEIGTQYISVAQKTGGILESICDTNWDNLLNRLGQDISSQITQIALEKVPVVPTINVFVDGNLWQGWTYIEGTNVIKFDSQHIPPEGSQIHIEYYSMK